MSNAIDCTVMGHPACAEPEYETEPSSGTSSAAPTAAPVSSSALFASYECVNECASSLGAATLVEGAVAGLSCLVLPPACPAFLVAVPLTILAACDAGCRELEGK
jgi:hypothetical protein